MTQTPLTQLSNRKLIDDAHNAGITSLAVAAAIDHRGQVLLVDGPTGCDFDWAYELPTALVLPGQTLIDTLEDLISQLLGGIEQITGYLGHHDQLDLRDEPVRTFGFILTASDPAAICRQKLLASARKRPRHLTMPCCAPPTIWPCVRKSAGPSWCCPTVERTPVAPVLIRP